MVAGLVLAAGLVTGTVHAYESERITFHPAANELVWNGREIGGSKADKHEYVQGKLLGCHATSERESRRKVKGGVGQGMSLGGTGAMLIVGATNPYALGPVLGFATVSVVGSAIWMSSMSYRKSLKLYEQECMGPVEESDYVAPDEVGDPDL